MGNSRLLADPLSYNSSNALLNLNSGGRPDVFEPGVPLRSAFVDGVAVCTTPFVPSRFLGAGNSAWVESGGVSPAGVVGGVVEVAYGPIPVRIGVVGGCDGDIG